MTTVEASSPRTATMHTASEVEVIQTVAGDIQRGDQVAFSSPDGALGEEVAGGVTGIRRSGHPTLALVVDNRVHFVPADHQVIIIRGCAPGGFAPGRRDAR